MTHCEAMEEHKWIKVIDFLSQYYASQMVDSHSSSIFNGPCKINNKPELLGTYVSHQISAKSEEQVQCITIPKTESHERIVMDNIPLFIMMKLNERIPHHAKWQPLVMSNGMDYDGLVYTSTEVPDRMIISKNLQGIHHDDDILQWAFGKLTESQNVFVISEFSLD